MVGTPVARLFDQKVGMVMGLIVAWLPPEEEPSKDVAEEMVVEEEVVVEEVKKKNKAFFFVSSSMSHPHFCHMSKI